MEAEDEMLANLGYRVRMAARGNAEVVRTTLAEAEALGLRGVVNYRGPGNKTTALQIATDSNQPDIVEVLLGSKDIDVNALDGRDETALSTACFRKRVKIVELLAARDDVDINYAEGIYGAPLRCACMSYSEHFPRESDTIVKALMKKANIRVCVWYALQAHHSTPQCLVLLLRAPHGIDVNEMPQSGRYVGRIAVQHVGSADFEISFARAILLYHTLVLKAHVKGENSTPRKGGRRGRRGVWLRRRIARVDFE